MAIGEDKGQNDGTLVDKLFFTPTTYLKSR
jgi:hypothetical protein